MLLLLDVCIWLCAVGIAYTYILYPLAIGLISGIAGRSMVRQGTNDGPSISVLIAVHNEADAIARKIATLVGQDYPAGKMEILIGSDGSTDDTVASAKRCGGSVRVYDFAERAGKPSVLNRLIPEAKGEILVFADARQEFAPDAIRMLVSNFADPKVGCVSGELMLLDDGRSTVGAGLGLYWTYEKLMRRWESGIHSMLGATGAIYAVRRNLVAPIPADTILDDMLIPLRVVALGYRAIFDPRAKAYDRIAQTPEQESRRKVRTLAGNVQLLLRVAPLLNPFRSPIAVQLFSHKLLRLVAPFLLVLLFVTNAFVAGASPWYGVLFIAQVIFYGLAYAGSIVSGKKPWIVGVPYMFCRLNYDAVRGIILYFSGRHTILWNKA